MKIMSLIFLFIFSDVKAEVLHLPFQVVDVKKELYLEAQLFTPPLVSPNAFASEVRENCQAFEELIPSRNGSIDLNYYQDLLQMPLASMMKPSYLVYLRLPSKQKESSFSSGQLEKDFSQPAKLEMSFTQDSFTQMGLEKFGFKPELTYDVKSDGAIWISFTRRDLFCDFLNKKLIITTNAALNFRFSEETLKLNQQRLQPLFDELNPILESSMSQRKKAAVVGYRLALYLKQRGQNIPENYRSVDYFWKLLFNNDENLNKNFIWQAISGANNFFVAEKNNILIKGSF